MLFAECAFLDGILAGQTHSLPAENGEPPKEIRTSCLIRFGQNKDAPLRTREVIYRRTVNSCYLCGMSDLECRLGLDPTNKE